MHREREAGARAWRAEAGATARLAAPLVLTNITQAGIQATDVVMLGWLGARELAASALGVNLYFAFLIFGMGLVTAASPLLSREIGARRNSVREVRRTVRQTLWAAAAFALPVWLVLWQAEPILRLLGQSAELSAMAADYVRVLQWGLLPALGYLVLRAFVAALERPAWSLLISIAGLVLNASLNYVLIFGALGAPRLGLEGAALASVITQVAMFAGMVVVVSRHRRFRRYRLLGRWWRADWRRFRDVWRLGAPIGVTLGLEVTVFNAAVFLMGLIGTAALAAHAIAIQLASLTLLVPLGLAQAVTVRVGLAFGRRDRAGIGRAGWTAFGMSVGFMALAASAMLSMPEPLVFAFLNEGDPANAEVIRLALAFLGIAALFQIVDGAQAVGAGMLRGLQDTKVPMIYAGISYWIVGMGTAVLLGFTAGWGGVGIWTGLAAGLAVASVLMLGRWIRRERLGLV